MRTLLAVLTVTVLFGPPDTIAGERLAWHSPEERVATIELFTSEGCSSCPPADRYLSSLTTSSDLWQKIIPLAFHVDYWDGLGWRDPYASPAHSARQRTYTLRGHLSQVYTPAFVVRGSEWRGFFRGGAIEAPAGRRVGRLSLTVDATARSAQVEFAASDPASDGYEVALALLGFGLESRVAAGENRGRVLTHDFVVLDSELAPLHRDGGKQVATLSLPTTAIDAKRLALVAWVARDSDPIPLQATGGFVPDSSRPALQRLVPQAAPAER